MNSNLVVKELVRCLRGKRSQMQLNRRLGVRSNQVYRWEAGTRQISWSDFVRVSKVCKVDLRGCLKRIFVYDLEPIDSKRVTRFLIGNGKISVISRESGISRFAISRWIKGTSEPSLAEVLLLMHICQHTLFEFVDDLVGAQNVPSLKAEFERRQTEKKIYFQNPGADAVLCCFELKSYKALRVHKVGFVAKTLGISMEEEKAAIADLLTVGALNYEKDKYQVSGSRPDLRGDFEGERRIKHHWYMKALKIIDRARSRSDMQGLGCAVFPVSSETLETVRREYGEFYFKIRSLLSQQEGNLDRVMAFDFMAFDVSNPKSGN